MGILRLRYSSVLAGVALGVGALVFAGCAASGSQAAEPVGVAAASADEAVAAYVTTSGAAYAGACTDAISPRDVGKVCSRFVEQRGSVRAYLTGRTFSEFTTWVFVAQTGAGWDVRGAAPLDFNDLSLTIPWPN